VSRVAPERGTDGALLVDKAEGPTSHDVVARVRRLFATRRVGHAGTLDPMATGVLVVLLGEATKLAPYLTAHDKTYEARVVLGRGTTTLDADGEVTEERPVPPEVEAELQALGASGRLEEALAGAPRIAGALEAELERDMQIPPAFSAIQVGGRRSYERARAGEEVDLAPRAVALRSVRLLRVLPETNAIDVEVVVSKGYYVRSFARDLGASLGAPAHLGALRRMASGGFRVSDAVRLDADIEVLRAAVRPLAIIAAEALPVVQLTAEGARRARLGQRLGNADFETPPAPGRIAWLDPDGRLVAVGTSSADGFAVERGFTS